MHTILILSRLKRKKNSREKESLKRRYVTKTKKNQSNPHKQGNERAGLRMDTVVGLLSSHQREDLFEDARNAGVGSD